jgi:hypothetical protein
LQTEEASNVFGHISTPGVKPNATTYSLLADAHLANKDPKAALAVIDKMVSINYHSKMYFCTTTLFWAMFPLGMQLTKKSLTLLKDNTLAYSASSRNIDVQKCPR